MDSGKEVWSLLSELHYRNGSTDTDPFIIVGLGVEHSLGIRLCWGVKYVISALLSMATILGYLKP